MSDEAVINLGCTDSEDEEPLPEIRRGRGRPRKVTRSKQSRSTRKRNCVRSQFQNKENGIVYTDCEKNLIDEGNLRKKKKIILEDGLELTLTDDSDEEVEQSIRVIWENTTEVNRFNLKPSDTFRLVYEYFSKKYGIPIERIEMTIRNSDEDVSMFSTIKSLNLKVTQVLEAYAVKEKAESCTEGGKGKIKIKCSSKTSKKPFIFFLYPQQDFSCIIQECSKELGIPVENIFLKFDGEKLKTKDTPLSLDLEGEECFEIYTK